MMRRIPAHPRMRHHPDIHSSGSSMDSSPPFLAPRNSPTNVDTASKLDTGRRHENHPIRHNEFGRGRSHYSVAISASDSIFDRTYSDDDDESDSTDDGYEYGPYHYDVREMYLRPPIGYQHAVPVATSNCQSRGSIRRWMPNSYSSSSLSSESSTEMDKRKPVNFSNPNVFMNSGSDGRKQTSVVNVNNVHERQSHLELTMFDNNMSRGLKQFASHGSSLNDLDRTHAFQRRPSLSFITESYTGLPGLDVPPSSTQQPRNQRQTERAGINCSCNRTFKLESSPGMRPECIGKERSPFGLIRPGFNMLSTSQNGPRRPDLKRVMMDMDTTHASSSFLSIDTPSTVYRPIRIGICACSVCTLDQEGEVTDCHTIYEDNMEELDTCLTPQVNHQNLNEIKRTRFWKDDSAHEPFQTFIVQGSSNQSTEPQSTPLFQKFVPRDLKNNVVDCDQHTNSYIAHCFRGEPLSRSSPFTQRQQRRESLLSMASDATDFMKRPLVSAPVTGVKHLSRQRKHLLGRRIRQMSRFLNKLGTGISNGSKKGRVNEFRTIALV